MDRIIGSVPIFFSFLNTTDIYYKTRGKLYIKGSQISVRAWGNKIAVIICRAAQLREERKIPCHSKTAVSCHQNVATYQKNQFEQIKGISERLFFSQPNTML